MIMIGKSVKDLRLTLSIKELDLYFFQEITTINVFFNDQ